jgi:2-polyprenyl-6-methoxyphenol hydroxylase-like FAD-dependent oxidoreductase
MEKVNEAARSVDVALEADVLVVGSGPGGLAAALAAARAGRPHHAHRPQRLLRRQHHAGGCRGLRLVPARANH